MADPSGKVLVTGAGTGIGKAIALSLAAEGYRIAAVGRRVEPLEALQAEIGDRCEYATVDVGDGGSVRALVDRFGDIDILVNNAGAAWGAPAEDHPLEAWDKVMNLNVRGYFLLSQRVAKQSMIERRQGRIINLASIAGLGGNPPEMQTIAYNTSKGAVINFTRALACEWGRYGITVNAICPGFFPSKMTRGTLAALGEDKLAAHAPLGRLGDDEDLKGITLLYASDAGKHITGQWLAVDGGVSVVAGG